METQRQLVSGWENSCGKYICVCVSVLGKMENGKGVDPSDSLPSGQQKVLRCILKMLFNAVTEHVECWSVAFPPIFLYLLNPSLPLHFPKDRQGQKDRSA